MILIIFLIKTHVLNYVYSDNSYHSAFTKVIMSSVCQMFHSSLSTDEYATCITILEGSPDQGLTQSLTHFIEGLIFMNNLYENYRLNSSAVYFWANETYMPLTGDNQRDNVLNLLRSNLSQGICKHKTKSKEIYNLLIFFR